MNLYNLVLRMVDLIFSYSIALVPSYLGIRLTLNFLDMSVFLIIFLILYKFVLFDRPSVSLKWMGVIFLCCRSVMSCHTLCHSELSVDHHCLKFHGRFVYLVVLPKAAGQVRHQFFLYLILLALYQFNHS
jgi:hypothetical protein